MSLVLCTLILYNPVTRNPFLNCDDDLYITNNPYIRNGLDWQTVKWAFRSTAQGGFWHPITWLSHALDIQLFQLNPAGHHLVSVFIHSCNAVLIFLLLLWVSKRWTSSLLVAALFAVHPLDVESVAWAAERKNVLSAFFFLATIAAYGWYTLRPNWRRYSAVAGLFFLGLATKPAVVPLPCALLLLDYWPLDRLKNSSEPTDEKKQYPWTTLVLEKAPLIALSLATSAITIIAQKAAGATRAVSTFSIRIRLENAIVSYATYVWKLVLPHHLTPVYPHPGNSIAPWQVAVSAAFLLATTAFAVLSRRKYLIVGWLWFLGILVPAIGLIQVGDQAMADRFAYIPQIGFFVMVVWGASELFETYRIQPILRTLTTATTLAALAFTTYHQQSYWRSNYALWTHALSIIKNNFIAEDNLGGALVLEGKDDEAHLHFLAAAQINPHDAMSLTNLGAYAQLHQHPEEAIALYHRAIASPGDPPLIAATYANLGAAQSVIGDENAAQVSFVNSLRLNPRQSSAWIGLALIAEKRGRYSEAVEELSRSIAIRPTAEAELKLAHALAETGHLTEAAHAYEDALKLSPGLVEAQQSLDALRQIKH